ncbi:hypothetical protein BO78DRAFT_116416 [Aspergillus sclerotiicarbonarius CBS 121057]|uniref:Uncharacterized protein n=1 Tax=Aspergillus sclerotiicarbonarius (strain CBS 121057 / IBT 28362) TaxID=1448318 RepID=A0A319EAT4_ASPSB|nr:hypothetical protein BO78DRAFT_116416 [Aspergillus sclerotiicarbonarius CBS 121057]
MRRTFGFLCKLDFHSIPEILLLRMQQTSEVWGSDGQTKSVEIPHMDPVITDLVSGDVLRFIKVYEDLGLVHAKPAEFNRPIYTIAPEVQKILGTEPIVSDIEWVVVVMVCHAFPGHWEEPWFADTGRVLLRHVQHTFHNCHDIKARIVENPDCGYKILLTLILSTKLPGSDWKIEALHMAEEILSSGPGFLSSDAAFLRGLVELRKLELSRRLQDVQFNRLDDLDAPTDPRSNYLHAAQRRWKAQDKIMQDPSDLNGAAEILAGFSPLGSSPSPMELCEMRQIEFLKAKIQRWLARFRPSLDIWNSLMDYFGPQYDDIGCSFWTHYVGTLCELHEFAQAEKWARHALSGLRELQKQGVHSKQSKRSRMLRLLLAETLTCQCLVESPPTSGERSDARLNEPRGIYEDLHHEYNALAKRDWASRFEHLRVHMGAALVAYLSGDRLEEARRRWEDVRGPAQYCEQHGKVTGFVEMLIQYSLCDIAARLGNMNEAHGFLRDAKARFVKIGREHWWTCLGTALLDLYTQSLSQHDLISGIAS